MSNHRVCIQCQKYKPLSAFPNDVRRVGPVNYIATPSFICHKCTKANVPHRGMEERRSATFWNIKNRG